MKVLTVVVPTYNTELYLDRCLRSLTYNKGILKDLEIIIVNDGSQDSSLQISQSYAQAFPDCVSVIDKSNGGHGSTINAGLASATGKYFRIVDSDDWVNIDDFGNYIMSLKKTDADIVLTNYRREMVYDGSFELFKYSSDVPKNELLSLDTFDLSKLDNDYFYLATSTFNTSKLRNANLKLDEGMFYVDMEYITLALKELTTFIYFDYDIYRYYIGRSEQSIDVKNMLKNRNQHEHVLKRLIDYYTSTPLGQNKLKYLSKILTLMINTHYYIYCSKRADSPAMRQEIKDFDKYLYRTAPDLYHSVAKNFTYIQHHRKTAFAFTRTMNLAFKRYVNWQDARLKHAEERIGA